MRTRHLTILSSLVLAAVAVTVSAQELMVPIERPKNAPVTVHEFMQHYRATHAVATRTTGAKRQRLSVKPNVIYGETADSAFLIPAAGNLPGGNGTYFRSDLSIGNFANTAQTIGVGWLATGSDNTTAPLQYFSIPANSVATYSDFVGQAPPNGLGKSGLGAILVISYNDAKTDVDQSGIIDGFSRIWTPEAGRATGTNSQSFPAISLFDSEGDFSAYALGLRQDGNFRTNVGVVNLDSVEHNFTVQSVYTSVSTTLNVKPYSLGQGGAPSGSANSSGYVALIITPKETNDFFWSAYASSVDNVTGDGWVSRATQ